MASPRDVVIIEGVRTPFAKAGSDLKDIHPAELGQIALKELFQMVITFGLTVFAWIFFRAEDINHAISYISGIFSKGSAFLDNFFIFPLSTSVQKLRSSRCDLLLSKRLN